MSIRSSGTLRKYKAKYAKHDSDGKYIGTQETVVEAKSFDEASEILTRKGISMATISLIPNYKVGK